jgi:hypothetical protein
MSICEMEHALANARRDERLAARRAEATRLTGLYGLVDLPPAQPDTQVATGAGSVYCQALRSWASWLLPPTLAAQEPQRPTSVRSFPRPRAQQTRITRGLPPGLRASELRSYEDRARMARTQSAHFLVEIHKKYAMAAACLIFVLVGVPTAIRFPRGGLGFVIGMSLGIFAIYYIGLIGGESLADRLVVPPSIMWAPNALFFVAGVILLRRSRSAGTAPPLHGLRAWLLGRRTESAR